MEEFKYITDQNSTAVYTNVNKWNTEILLDMQEEDQNENYSLQVD